MVVLDFTLKKRNTTRVYLAKTHTKAKYGPFQAVRRQAHLKLPDLLALLGDLPHRLPHQGDQHVKQQHKGEDDVGHQQDEEHCGVLGAVDHVQLSHSNGQLKEVQQEGAEGVRVPAVWVGGTVAFTLGARGGAHGQQRHQGCRMW